MLLCPQYCIRLFIWILLLLSLTAVTALSSEKKEDQHDSGTIRYVKAGAVGDGSTWANASGNLQAMIDASAAGDEVWVAKGSYLPALNTSFAMKADVTIFGGFPDSGDPLMIDRSYQVHQSILGPNGSHIISNPSSVTQSAILDGFILTGTTSTSAMLNQGASPSVKNCIFKDNTSGSGAAVFNRSASKPVFTHCIFQRNTGNDYGGAIYSIDNSETTVSNCIFVANHSPYGPGIATRNSSRVVITNSTFFGNTGRGALTLLESSEIKCYNTILWGTDEEGTSRYGSAVISLTYGISRTGNGTGVKNTDPLFVDSSNPEGSDGIWGTNDDGLRLSTNSPGINSGDPQSNTADYEVQAGTRDMIGNSRLFDSRIDLGAYENPKRTQTITIQGSSTNSSGITSISASYGTADYLPLITTSEGTYTLSYDANLVFSLVDGKIHMLKAGNANLTISSPGNEEYDPATKILRVIVNAIAVTPRLNPAHPIRKVYDGDNSVTISPENFIIQGVLPGEDVYLNFSYSYTEYAEPGIHKLYTSGLNLAGANRGNYLFDSFSFIGSGLADAVTITPRPVSVSAVSAGKIYGQADPSLTYTVADGGLLNSDVISGEMGRQPGEDAGTYEITKNTLTAGSNYEINFTSADFTISKAEPLITGYTDISKTFGDAPFVISPTSSSTGEFSYASSNASVATFSNSILSIHNAGTSTISISQAETVNYLAKTVTLTLTVNKANPSLVFKVDHEIKDNDTHPANVIYGESRLLAIETNSDAAIAAYELELLDNAQSPLIDFSGMPAIKAIKAGTTVMEIRIPETLNFYAASGRIKFNIAKKALSLKANAQSKTYGDSDPELSYTFSPALVSGDAFSGKLSRMPGEAVGLYAIVQNTLSLGDNYTLDFTGADLSIGRKVVSVSASPKNKTYGDADPELSYTFSPDLLPGDTFSGKLSRAAGEAAGVYPIVQHTLSLGNNYSINFRSADFSIGKRLVSIKAEHKTKVYGDTDPELTYKVMPALLVGDELKGSPGRQAGEQAGVYAIFQNTLDAGSNYNLNFEGAALTIQKKQIEVKVADQIKQYGDPDPVLTYTISASGLSINDKLEGNLSRTAGENVGTYAIAQGSLNGGSNYQINFNGGFLLITKKPLLVKAEDKSRVFAAENPTLTLHYDGFIKGENESNLISKPHIRTNADSLSPLGKYPIIVEAASAVNYDLSYLNGTLSILAAPQQIIFPELTEIRFRDTVLTFTASTASGLAISYQSSDTSVLKIMNANRGRVIRPGNVIITAMQEGDGNYAPAVPVSRTLRITENPAPLITISSNLGLKINKGDTIVLTASGAISYQWDAVNGFIGSLNESTLIARPPASSTFRVTGTDEYGKTATQEIIIEVIEAFDKLTSTNILTPNGDGVNDVWIVKNIEMYPNNEVQVFDSMGKTVFRTRAYQNDWNATLNGRLLQEGTYYYIIRFDDGIPLKKGFITLLKN